MQRVSLVLLLLSMACKKASPAAHEVPPPEPVAARAEPKRSADIPEWSPIEIADGAPAEPVAWAATNQPTLAVFSASWCPGCTASALADRALVRSHGKDFQIGVALQEEDDAFSRSHYARALTGVPVWSDASTEPITKACRPMVIPSACLFDHGKVLWSGDASEAPAILDARKAGKLDAYLADADAAEELANVKAKQALKDPSKIDEVVAATHGRAGWQNSYAWDLVDRESPSPNEVALGVALARDAVAADGGVDFAHLDTYALALSKAGKAQDAAYVGARVIAVCDAIEGKCDEERRRAQAFIARAATN